MWSQKTKTGKYQYFERYKNPLTGKYKVLSITLDGNRRSDEKAAERALDEKIRIALLPTSQNADITYGFLVDRYLEYQRREHKPQTAVSCELHFRGIRKCIGDDVLLSSLTAPYVRQALWSDKPTTYNERLKYFKASIRYAYREEMITDISFLDRLQKVKVPTARVRDAEKYLERDELQRLLDAMRVEDWRILTRFLALSGLRIGELIALTAADVDLAGRNISVNKTFSLVIDDVTTTKTETSTRDVFIQDELLPVCRDIMRRRTRIRKDFGVSSPLFFPGDDGGYIKYPAYLKYFRENCTAAVGRPLSPHALRHTHVALLAEHGISLEIISRRLGHSGSQITRDVYFHVTEKLKDLDREALRKISLL